jgi:molecular chaperone DnaJ
MAKQDYYDTLDVNRGAGEADLKKAYRKLAMQYHPDRNPDDASAERRFKEVSEAYAILRDSDKRAAYDRFGHAAFENGGGGPGAGGFDFNFGAGFADIFDEMFGEFMGGNRGGGAQRGADLRYNMEISLEEAFEGKTAEIRVPTSISCEPCTGTGAAKGSSPVTCGACKGRGRMRAQQGFFTIERTCPSCHGIGRVIERPCTDCQGAGRVEKTKSLKINIPAGVEEGTRIRLTGEGEAGIRGAASGDLYIFLAVRPHRLFQRNGADIYCRAPIPMTTASLGGTIEVPAIDGSRARITLPPGTQSNRQFRLKAKGMRILRSNARGDMYIEVTVETPVNLTKRQRELLQTFEEAGKGRRTSPESEGFFVRVKEFWEDLTE